MDRYLSQSSDNIIKGNLTIVYWSLIAISLVLLNNLCKLRIHIILGYKTSKLRVYLISETVTQVSFDHLLLRGN